MFKTAFREDEKPTNCTWTDRSCCVRLFFLSATRLCCASAVLCAFAFTAQKTYILTHTHALNHTLIHNSKSVLLQGSCCLIPCVFECVYFIKVRVWCVVFSWCEQEESSRDWMWTSERTRDPLAFLCPITGTSVFIFLSLNSTFPFFSSSSAFSLCSLDPTDIFYSLYCWHHRKRTSHTSSSGECHVRRWTWSCVYVALSRTEKDSGPSGLWNLSPNWWREYQKAVNLTGRLSELHNSCLFEIWRYKKKSCSILSVPSVQSLTVDPGQATHTHADLLTKDCVVVCV